MNGKARGRSAMPAPVTPHWRRGSVMLKPRSTVRHETKRASAGAHMASGTSTPHWGERTVQPIERVSSAIAAVAPTEIALKTRSGPATWPIEELGDARFMGCVECSVQPRARVDLLKPPDVSAQYRYTPTCRKGSHVRGDAWIGGVDHAEHVAFHGGERHTVAIDDPVGRRHPDAL